MTSSKKLYFPLVMIAVLAIALGSCSKKISPLSPSWFNTNPSPLELVGTKVPVTINGNIPEKWFNKNVTLTITPVLKYNGQEALGTTQTYQGENVAGNGIVIPEKAGGNITLRSEFDYVPEMIKSELYLRFTTSMKGKVVNLPEIKIADGVSSAAFLASAFSTTPAQAPDKFQRIIKESYDADILFLIQQAELRSSELNSSNIAAWKDLVKNANDDDKKNIDVEVSAYASPDGGYKLNEGLAEKREKNTTGYLTKEFKKNNIDTEINAKYTAQDWDGFQKLVAASSLQDKDLVLRVLSMYTDPETREQEIKNISVVYKDLAETILPKLRRSRLIANVEIIGKTDNELISAVSNNIGSLSIEELLYSSALVNDTQKEKIYTQITQKYPTDYRGWNNLGALYFQNGQIEKATSAFNKAKEIAPKSAETNMNLALLSIAKGDIANGEQLLGYASGANTLNEALGLLYLKKGDYSKAVQSFGNAKTNNAALAQLLSKDYNKAQETINGIAAKDATSYYIATLLAARTNNTVGVASNLREALQKDASIGKHALKDLELSKYLANPDIANMLR